MLLAVYLAKPIVKAGKMFWVYAQECTQRKNVTTRKMTVNTGDSPITASFLANGIAQPARLTGQT